MTFFGSLLLLASGLLYFDYAAEAIPASNGSYRFNARRLRDYLMEDYTASLRPVNHYLETVTVHLDLRSFLIEDLDEKNQAFMFSADMFQTWTDEGLVWNKEDFDGMIHIDIPISEIWYPDIGIINSKDAYYKFPDHHKALVTYTGEVFWEIPINVKTHCQLDLTEFPFDEQACLVVFSSWGHADLAINLTVADMYIDPTNLVTYAVNENLEWQLMNVTFARHEKRFACCNDDVFSDVTYTFTIRRRSSFATHLFVGPSVMLCLVTPLVFLLPPGSGVKVTFGIGIVIADTLLLGQLIDYIPSAHPNLPLIAKYYVSNIVLASLSLVISAIIIGFWDKSSSRLSGPPAFFRLFCLGPVAKVLCLKKYDFIPAEETSNGGAIEINRVGENDTESNSGVDPETNGRRRFWTNYERNAARSEWRQLSVVFDRLFLVIYCVIVVILTLLFARYI